MAGSPYVVLGLMFLVGAVLYGIGTLLVRSANAIDEPQTNDLPLAPKPLSEPVAVAPTLKLAWTRALVDDDQPLDIPERIDMIERLAFVGEAWCIQVIEAAAREDADEVVRVAATRYLQRTNR